MMNNHCSSPLFILAVFSKDVVLVTIFKMRVEWSGRHLTPVGGRGKAETPQAKPRRLSFLPAESKCLEQNGTTKFSLLITLKAQKQLLL
ncbi:hypothetical protein ACEWK1_10930 [Metabacillus sp. YM-086]|uniref:hypothetical protein n=1 Tax=Metabacillus sp. YM-086 TaxID=3341729 RepID=UPI003A83B603